MTYTAAKLSYRDKTPPPGTRVLFLYSSTNTVRSLQCGLLESKIFIYRTKKKKQTSEQTLKISINWHPVLTHKTD